MGTGTEKSVPVFLFAFQRIDGRQDLGILHGIQDSGVDIISGFLVHSNLHIRRNAHALQADALGGLIAAGGNGYIFRTVPVYGGRVSCWSSMPPAKTTMN